MESGWAVTRRGGGRDLGVTSMHAWITLDGDGREVLVRTGTGRVTAVVAIGADGEPVSIYRVEIDCDAPAGRARAIRYSVHGLLAADDPRVIEALELADRGERLRWTVEWHRHAWVPADLPIGSLDLATDAMARVTELLPVELAIEDSVDASDLG